MSEKPPSVNAVADARELEEIAAALYALRPDDFAAARDEDARTARAEGRAALARELSRLRRPTQSAWLINLLWRDQRDVMQQLFQLADELRQAQAQASGPDLHRLTAQRRELEAALIRRARELAEKAGVSVSASMEREAQETLAAALAQPEVAEEVRTGRLVKPASYAGFGTGFGTLAAAAEAESTRGAASRPPPPADFEAHAAKRGAQAARDGETARDDEAAEQLEAAQRRAAAERIEQAKRREAAEQKVAQARAAVEAAADALADHERVASAARQHQQDVRRALEQLEQQLRDLQAEVAAAEQASRAAEQERERAEKAHTEARRVLDGAEQQLEESEKGG